MRGQIIKVFYDLETTGVNPRRHSIHQLAGLIEVDGKIDRSFDIKTRPHPKAEILPDALKVGNVTLEQVQAYKPMKEAYVEFTSMILEYVDKYDTQDKCYLVGYNNRYFDDVFLRAWFEQNGDQYIGSYFWNNTLDVLVLATEYLLKRRAQMSAFKLKSVCRELGIEYDESKLHNGVYDVELTREIYQIVTGLEIEM
jgi:DNA polymerase-3 subunit epsilon